MSWSGRLPPWLVLSTVAVVAVVVYWPALQGDMLWDDDAHITRAELRSWQGLSRIWFEVVGPELPRGSADDPSYAQGATQQFYPLLHSAFWLQWHLWGDNMVGYHVANLLLHLGAMCLVYAVLRKLHVPGALLAAAIFALHPLQAESVAWVTEQKNTLSTVFYLSAMLAYLHFDERRSASWYFAALAFFVLGLLSKTVTATLPAALLVIFWWLRSRDPAVLQGLRPALSWRRDVLPLLPFFVLGAAMGLFTAWIEHNVIAAVGDDFKLSFIARCLLAGRVVWFYLGKLLWPAELMFFYPRWTIDATDWRQWLYPISVVAVLVALWAIRQRTRAPLAAALFFVGTLFPALGFFNVYPFRFSYVADHFQYLSCVGIIALFSAAVATALERVTPRVQDVGICLCALLVVLMACLTRIQASMYTSDTTLFETVLRDNPECWLAYHSLGVQRLNANRVPDALALLERETELKPDFWGGHLSLGIALLKAHRHDEALKHLEQAAQLKPRAAAAHLALGKAFLDAGEVPRAIEQLEQALKLNSRDADTHNNLGMALRNLGQTAEAIDHYEQALRIKPDFAAAHSNLAVALVNSGRLAEAIEHFEQALKSDPNFAEAHGNLALLLLQVGRSDEALDHLQIALRLKPDYVAARTNLAIALVNAGQLWKAVDEFQAALKSDPDFVDAHSNLATLLLQLNKPDQALSHLEAVLRQQPDNAQAWANQASAHAQLGHFGKATTAAERAATLAREQGQAQLAAQLEAWLPQLRRSAQSETTASPEPGQ